MSSESAEGLDPGPVVAPSGSSATAPAEAGPPVKVFINYRRDEAAGDARLLYGQLVDRFGKENVFLDVKCLQSGMDWLKGIDEAAGSCTVFVALIGTRWAKVMADRASGRYADPAEDYVVREIESVLERDSGATILPVLIDTATMPGPERLPRPIRALSDLQGLPLRHDLFDDDIERILERIEQAPRVAPPPPDEEYLRPTPAVPLPSPPAGRRVADPPDPAHYESVVRHIMSGALVVFLGPQAHGGDRGGEWRPGSGRLPDAEELALGIAREYNVTLDAADLPAVAQYVLVSSGAPDLYRTLTALLPRKVKPSPLHRFLALLPGEIEHVQRRKRYQLIVTTNYDTALETAFDDAREPYDLALYMASGPDKGKFVHVPFEDDSSPEAIGTPNEYGEFPVDDTGELVRTVIVKIHGALDGRSGSYQWRENCVITEDQYIDYLSRSPVEQLVPVQILEALYRSHWLFLGYTMRDWNLRVFLNRVLSGDRPRATSWAIERDPDEFEKDLWKYLTVELFSSSLIDYIAGLSAQLGQSRARP